MFQLSFCSVSDFHNNNMGGKANLSFMILDIIHRHVNI